MCIRDRFATESMLDIAAEKLNMDPFEIRRINAFVKGNITHTKQELNSASINTVLNELEKLASWEKGSPQSRGNSRKDMFSKDNRDACELGARLKTNGNGKRAAR